MGAKILRTFYLTSFSFLGFSIKNIEHSRLYDKKGSMSCFILILI